MESTEATVMVEYLGNKDRKDDNVSGSHAVWHGAGDIQPVTHAQWGALSKHPEVWRKVVKQPAAMPKADPLPPALKADATKAKEAAKALSLDTVPPEATTGLSVEQVHAFKFNFPEEYKADKQAKPADKSAKKGAK